ncbi:unnamed protein product [Lymnaea stagnalis]|uniref:Uncharacterized protein n=1 Tax=Lymnaea stagnalis TaxID=6523 RepID=A0AAV2I328_LYMST
MSQYGNEDDATLGPFTRTVNALQKKLRCCGWEGGADYSKVDRAHWNTTLAKGQQRTVPDSCCPNAPNATWTQDCAVSPLNSTYYSSQGCRAMIETEFKTYQWVVIGVTIGVLAFQLLVIIMALVLVVHNVNNKYDMS